MGRGTCQLGETSTFRVAPAPLAHAPRACDGLLWEAPRPIQSLANPKTNVSSRCLPHGQASAKSCSTSSMSAGVCALVLAKSWTLAAIFEYILSPTAKKSANTGRHRGPIAPRKIKHAMQYPPKPRSATPATPSEQRTQHRHSKAPGWAPEEGPDVIRCSMPNSSRSARGYWRNQSPPHKGSRPTTSRRKAMRRR